MTNKQKENIERVILTYERKSDREDDRICKYEKEGNNEKVSKAIARQDIADSAINAIQEVLNLIGYYVKWEVDSDYRRHPHILEY